MARLERAITDEIMERLERVPNSVVWKIHGNRMQGSGKPDLYFTCAALKGRSVWIESKRPGEEPSKLQSFEIRRLRRAEAVAFKADSVDDVVHALLLLGVREGLV